MFRRAWVFTKQTYLSFIRDDCTQQAAAISYYVLFSIVPLTIFLVSVLGFVWSDAERRSDIVDQVVDTVPLSDTDGRDAVDDALTSARGVSGPVAAVALAITLWTASAMFGSIRRALNTVWRAEEHRPYFRAKLVDLAQIGVLGLILVGSIALTAVLRTVREESLDRFGPLAGDNVLWELPPVLLPAALTLTAFALLYRYVPAAHPRWYESIMGALLATVLFEVLKNTFALYVANYNNYNVIYGSLAGVLLFLLNTYLASIVVLAGAEFARTVQRFRRGELDAIIAAGPGDSITQQTLRALKGLFVRQ